MRLYDEFKDSLVGELNTEEIRELAKFAAALSTVKRKRDAEAVQGLMKQAAAEITDVDDYYYVENLLNFLEKTAADSGKKGFDMGRAAQIGMYGLTGAAAIAPLAMQMYRSHQAKKKYEGALMGVRKDHPDLFSPTKVEQTQRNYGVLKDFAPQIAQNSLVAGNVLKRMEEYGPRAMDINVVKEMAQTQDFVSKSNRNPDTISPALGGGKELAKMLAGDDRDKKIDQLKSDNAQLEAMNAQAKSLMTGELR